MNPGDRVRVTETVTVDGLMEPVLLVPEMILTVLDTRPGAVRLNYGWGGVWIPSRLVEVCE